MDNQPWYVYLLSCKSNRIYTGVTPDLTRRFDTHLLGKGALFTRINMPEELLAAKPYASKREAMRMEHQIKRLSRAQKQYLAERWSQEHPLNQIR